MRPMARVVLLGSALLLLAGVALMTFFAITGTQVDENGFLVEEFWAWGLGIWLFLTSLAGFALWGVMRLWIVVRKR